MLKRWISIPKTKVLRDAGIIMTVIAAALTGSTPARALSPTYTLSIWWELGGASGCTLHAHAHNLPVFLYCGGDPAVDQTWIQVNPEYFNFPVYGKQLTYEVRLFNVDQCLNVVGDYTVYLDSCQNGDLNELFWQRPIDSHADYWYINAGATRDHHANQYMTNGGGYIDVQGAGEGPLAEWFSG